MNKKTEKIAELIKKHFPETPFMILFMEEQAEKPGVYGNIKATPQEVKKILIKSIK